MSLEEEAGCFLLYLPCLRLYFEPYFYPLSSLPSSLCPFIHPSMEITVCYPRCQILLRVMLYMERYSIFCFISSHVSFLFITMCHFYSYICWSSYNRLQLCMMILYICISFNHVLPPSKIDQRITCPSPQ